jgi:hypothetical protein
MIIARLVFRDRRASKRSGQSTCSGTNRCAPPAGGGTTDECTSSCARERPDAGALARWRFARAKKQRDKNGGHTRRYQILFHNFEFFLDSKVEAVTDAPSRYSE